MNIDRLMMSVFSLAAAGAVAAEKIDFMTEVKPILEFNCTSCHNEKKDKGDLRLDTKKLAFTSGDDGPAIVAGKPEKSSLYTLCMLPADDDDIMPPIKKAERDYPLTSAEKKILHDWIKEGASWPDGVTLTVHKRLPKKVDFVEHIKPILEENCVSCHGEKKDKGDLRLHTLKAALTTGENAPTLIPGKPMESSFFTLTLLPEDDDDVMPPAKKGLLDATQIAMLRRWIEEGAKWPEDVTLAPVKKAGKTGGGLDPKVALASLGLKPGPVADAHKAHEIAIPDTEYVIDLLPIPGGEFTMGSPASEAGRNADEGPQKKIGISPFWMQKTEMTWDIYEMWQMDVDRQRRTSLKTPTVGRNVNADTITRPTPPYTDMTFSMGKNGFPAICMTHLAAKTFCMWLSTKTGHFFRLPTEAEWEYACRAGTKTAYHFGEDASKLGDYAWFAENSDFQYQKIGLKKPNPWGLHDMHGNVSEWVLDQYKADGYAKLAGKDPVVVPTTLYPRAVRGGNWDQDAPMLRTAIRAGSDESWKQQDPQIPQSVWYHTDALGVGFRVIRATVIPSPEDLHKYWPTKEELQAVPQR